MKHHEMDIANLAMLSALVTKCMALRCNNRMVGGYRMWHDAARIFLTSTATNARLACLTKILPIHNTCTPAR
jgi:hypothetical protein